MDEVKLFNSVEFGERIRYLRKSLGLSLNQLASSIGVTKGFLGLVERGERGLSLEYLCRLAEVLQTSTDELLVGKENANVSVSSPLQKKASVLVHALNDSETELVISIIQTIMNQKENDCI